jgi:hypothetical protein
MALTTSSSFRKLFPPSVRQWHLPELDLAAVVATAVVALALAVVTHSHNLGPVPTVLRGGLASLVVFAVSGSALAVALIPAEWGVLALLLAVPLGAAASGLALTALGLAGVPLRVSLWLVLAGGLVAGALVIRRRTASRIATRQLDRRLMASWLGVLVLLFCVAMIPAWRTHQTTIYGQNPDSQQVVGIAVLFQHVGPTGTDVALPLDTVPPAWRFRYPIFYPLAGASNLAHLDPIRVFPTMAALLVVMVALGFGALAVRCLRAPPVAGPAVAAAAGLSVITLHLAWHPYWNQLWGLAMLPYAILFGWCALEKLDVRLAALCALLIAMLALAYPLALPDPLVILAALALGYRRRPRLIAALRSRSWIFGLACVLVLAPAVIGAAVKLAQGASQLLSPHSTLWGGDVAWFMPVGRFVGVGGGILPALAVAAVALLGLRHLPRRVAWWLGLAVFALCLVDVRFRLVSSGAYMDFKQLSFVGAVVLAIAVAAVSGLLSSRRSLVAVAGVVLVASWTAAAAVQDRREILSTEAQVTPGMFQIRSWANRLPRGASVRVDIPPSGTQLWAVYMLGARRVDSPTPILSTTYAHAPFGVRADYSLALRTYPGTKRPFPTPAFAQGQPLFESDQFVLRRIVWPARYASIPDTSSQTLVEP